MGKINGYIEHTGAKFQELSLEASAQGMTVTLKHSVDGNKFTGKLSAVLGTIEWSGTTGDETLKSLKITGTSPVGSLTANLTESGSMVVGPVVVKSGEETIFNANLALQIAKQKFAIILDVLSEAFPAHFDLDISGKSTPSTKRVVAPTSSKSFQDLMTEISELTPADPSFSDLPSESSLSDTGSVGLPQ